MLFLQLFSKCTLLAIMVFILSACLEVEKTPKEEVVVKPEKIEVTQEVQPEPTAPEKPVLSVKAIKGDIKKLSFGWEPADNVDQYTLLQKSGSGAGFEKIAGLTGDTYETKQTYFLPELNDYEFILKACNELGCKESDVVPQPNTINNLIGYFKASDSNAGDKFAYQVAISHDGKRIAVTAPNKNTYRGASYIFSYAENQGWHEEAIIVASNAENYDELSAVSLSADGNILALGAKKEGSNATGINGNQADNSAGNSGAAYIYMRDSDGQWQQQAYIKASNAERNDYFGEHVALSADGKTLAVSAIGERSNATTINGDQSNNSVYEAGAVYMFIENNGIWQQQAYIKASNAGSRDRFGKHIAISDDGNTLIVGASGEDSIYTGSVLAPNNNSLRYSGAAYVFTRSNDTWQQVAMLKASNADENDEFGEVVGISGDGNTIAVAALKEKSAAQGFNGDQSSNDTHWGGAVYLFELHLGSWQQVHYIKAPNTRFIGRFGSGIDFSSDGNFLIIDAMGDSSNAIGLNGDLFDSGAPTSGATMLYKKDANDWRRISYIKTSNSGSGDRNISNNRNGIAISGNGKTIVVGAAGEDSNAKGIGGDDGDNSASGSGAVYIY